MAERASGRQGRLSRRPATRPPAAPQGIIFGRHPVQQLLACRPQALQALWLLPQHFAGDAAMAQLLALAQQHGVAVARKSRAQLDACSQGGVHQGVLAHVRPFAYVELDALLPPEGGPATPLIVVLDQVQDPHNLGALTRSAAALGATGVIIGQDRSAQMEATAIKASAGAAYLIPVARVVNVRRALDTLRQNGVWLAGLSAGGATPVYEVDWCRPMALVVGSEGMGLRPLVAQGCDWLVQVPIARVGSLNASVAGAIALYAASLQRSQPGSLAAGSPQTSA